MKNLNSNFERNITICILYTVLCWAIFYYVAFPKIIEHRERELGLLRYDSKINKMVEKDSLFLSDWDLRYLKKGTMNGHIGD